MDHIRLGTSSEINPRRQTRRRSRLIPSFVLPLTLLFLATNEWDAVPDQPSTKITKAFLNTGILPGAQDSELVTVYPPGMKRGPISDPYQVPTGAPAGGADSGNVTVEIPF